MIPPEEKRLLSTVRKAVRKAVRDEVRVLELFDRRPSVPPPCDYDAEQEICAAILSGVPPEALKLEPQDFFARWFREVFAAALGCDVRSINNVARAMFDAGNLGLIREELQRLVELTPMFSAPRLAKKAERLRELRRRRDLIRVMARLDAALRTDQCTADKALEVLARRAVKAADA